MTNRLLKTKLLLITDILSNNYFICFLNELKLLNRKEPKFYVNY